MRFTVFTFLVLYTAIHTCLRVADDDDGGSQVEEKYDAFIGSLEDERCNISWLKGLGLRRAVS